MPLLHGLQGPPQSMPSSPWFLIPSKQLIAPGISSFMHGLQGPPQSMPVSCPFCTPSLHVGHLNGQGPPQSMPSSFWFWILSEQLGHGRHSPPQSTPNSSPFLMLSLHVGPYSQRSLSFGLEYSVPHCAKSLHFLVLMPVGRQAPKGVHSQYSSQGSKPPPPPPPPPPPEGMLGIVGEGGGCTKTTSRNTILLSAYNP